MTQLYYPAVVTKGNDGLYLIELIDMENVFSDGTTVEEAVANCTDALAGVLDVMQEHGDKIPPPTPFAEATAKVGSGKKKARVTVLVPATLRGRTMKISVTMDEELVKRIDAAAGHYGRSEFLDRAARTALSRERDGSAKQLTGRRLASADRLPAPMKKRMAARAETRMKRS